MRNVSKQKYFNFLILLSLLQRISCEFGSANEERDITPRTGQENNFSDESQDDTIITTTITFDDEKFDDNELRKLFVQKFWIYAEEDKKSGKNYNKISMTKHKHESLVQKRIKRTDSDLEDIGGYNTRDSTKQPIECFQCYSDRTNDFNSRCFKGINLPRETCLAKDQCYSEIHHDYVRRGCASANRNRTFVCKCPLCNDKNVDDLSNFEYKSIDDWKYDNKRLRRLTMGIEIMCKVCDTKGISKSIDKICRYGRKADHMVCGPSQLCYTNIEEETNYVSRGCISMPIYNPMYLYCNDQLCNNQKFEVDVRRRSLDDLDSDLPTRSFISRSSCYSFQRRSILEKISLIWLIFTFVLK